MNEWRAVHVIPGSHNHDSGWGFIKDCPACEAWCDETIAKDPTSRPRDFMMMIAHLREKLG